MGSTRSNKVKDVPAQKKANDTEDKPSNPRRVVQVGIFHKNLRVVRIEEEQKDENGEKHWVVVREPFVAV